MHELLGLVAFAFAGSVSPGPNNTLLWASGMGFGFRRTIPHVLGTALGIGVLAVAMAAGLDVILDAVPAFEVALKVTGSVYLLVLAALVIGGGPIGRMVGGKIGGTDSSHPLTVWQASGFQFVNPKAWIFAIAAVGTFFPAHRTPLAVIVLTGSLLLVVVVSSSIWAAGGAALGRVIENERTIRAVNLVLAALLVASVALIWV
jgi:threonine/homoserine/homoserine lactone efflux protein